MVAQCLQLEVSAKARVKLTPPPLVITGECEHDKGQLHAHYIPGRTSCDFDGHICGAGRRVSFDTKWTGKDRFEFSNVRDTQLAHLAHLSKDGCAAFLYVRHNYSGPYNHDYLVYVDDLRRIAGVHHQRSCMPSSGPRQRASLAWSELDEYRVAPGETWLDAWLRLEKKLIEIDDPAQAIPLELGLGSLVL